MITNIYVDTWLACEVRQWLLGLCDDATWINDEYILNNGLTGPKLLMISPNELYSIGAKRVELQEHILDAACKLRECSSKSSRNTLQIAMLRLACKTRSLQKQLVASRESVENKQDGEQTKQITLTSDFQQEGKSVKTTKQRVELNTLTCVSDIVKTVIEITEMISRTPFSKYSDYRSMKGLILALSIELTSTAQRDQFVIRPNDIIEKSCKALADYCDRVVYGTKDLLLIQPTQIKTVKLKKGHYESDHGLSIRSLPGNIHIIYRITPLSAAKKTNELVEGDEIIFMNQCIVGWSEGNVKRLLEASSQLGDITLMVRKNPSDD